MPKRVSLESLTRAETQPKTSPPLDVVKEEPRRKDRPHTTIYLDRRVMKVIRQTAADLEVKPHDLLIQGVDLMLAHHGRPSIAKITRG